MAGTHPAGAGPERTVLRDGVVRIEVDGELLLLDRATGTVARLDAAATEALGRGTARGDEVREALDALGLTAGSGGAVGRRRVLEGAFLAGLGISLLALPGAATATSIGFAAGEEPFALAAGTVTSYNPNVNSFVNAIVVQDDGAVVLGGAFTSIGGITRNRIARIHPNGGLDVDFDPNAGGTVHALALDSNGRIVLGGQFTNVGGQARNRLARLHPNGSLDTLSLNLNANVNGLAVQQREDGEVILATGSFQVNIGTTMLRRLVRILPDGTPDPAWSGIGPGFDGHALLVDGAGGVLVGHAGGTIGFWYGTTLADRYTERAGIARIGPDDTIDTTFPYLDGDATAVAGSSAPVHSTVRALAADGSGRIYLGGSFQTTFGNGGPVRRWLARLDADGTIDTDFAPALSSNVLAIAIQSDGRPIIGGGFTTVDGQTRNRIARLHADTAGTGFLDTTFDPNASGNVNALAIQANGRVVLGGAFTTVGGQTRNRLARLD